MTTVRFTVTAVYQAPTTIARNALGLPDALIPWTAEGGAQRRAQPVRLFVVETDGASGARTAAAIRHYLSGMGQADPEITAWEGSPFDPMANGAVEARRMLATLSATLVSLGALVLLVSVLGVYTWTSMEAADSAKQTAIRRALGESAAGSVKRFVASIAAFGALAGLVGALLSLPAYRLLSISAEAILIANGTADSGLFPALPPAWAPSLAVLVTIVICALFALPPAISASRQTITSGIQEL
jgi:predicted lysophospholipase L1 biosynthesis ABC-type transport system permease subunit